MLFGSGLIKSHDTTHIPSTSTSRVSEISELATIEGDEVNLEPPSKQLHLDLAENANPNINLNPSTKTPDLELQTLAGLSKQIRDLSSDVKILINENKRLKQNECNHQEKNHSALNSVEKHSVISYARSIKSILKWLDD